MAAVSIKVSPVWKLVYPTASLTAAYIQALVIDPAAPGTLYAGAMMEDI